MMRAAATLVGVAFVSAAAAQTPLASLRGMVRDPSAAPVADVRMTLVHEQTNEQRVTTSDAAGQFVVTAIPPGDYRLEIEQSGYKKYTQRLRPQVNQDLRIDVNLELGTIAESVEVTAPAASVDRLRTALATVVDGRQLAGLPLDGRNFLELSLLAPGTAPGAEGSAGSVRGDFAFHVNGGREDSNSSLLDGVLNVDPKLNTFGVAPPVDAVQEFEIVTSTPDASFGRNAAGHVNVVVKSGANRASGSAYEFFRDRALNARNYFAPKTEPAPAYRRNQFGGSFGGPIVRNRTFFFGDYEGTRTREGVTMVTNVPTLAERNGDFSRSLFARPINPYTGQPFPAARIPSLFLSPIGLAIAGLYPLPNRDVPFQNFVSSPASTDRRDQFDLRVDHGTSSRATIMARYSLSDRDFFEPFSGPGFAAVPGFGSHVPRRAQNVMVGERRSLSPTLFNEARLGYTRLSGGVFPENGGTSLNRQVGLPELATNSRDWGLSLITISGFSPLGHEYNNPQASTIRQIQFADTLTWTRGRHLVKFGADMRALAQDAYRDVQARGFLTFSDQVPITGNALADLLLGLPVVTGGARLDNAQRLRTSGYSAFVHDSFWMTPRVTVSAGLRYEYNAPPVDADNRANVYDPATRSMVRVGTGGLPRGGYAPDRNNWAPRVGVAWNVDAAGDTVVRAGYGIYYDQSSLAPSEGLYFNPPYFDLRLYFPLPGLPLLLSNPFPQQFPVTVPPSGTTYQRDFQTAHVHQWNVNLQRQLGHSRLVEVAYVGSKGQSLLRGRDINQPPASPSPFNLRPVAQFADITLIESKARSDYKSLQLSFKQRLAVGVSALAAYTWSSSHDDASGLFTTAGDPNFPQDSRNPQAEWSRSNYDLRHRLSLGFTCDMPFGTGSGRFATHGWVSDLLANWEVTGILTLQSGRPFTVALLPEFDNSNTGRSSLGFGANDRPDLVGDPTLSARGPNGWFNTAAFAVPPFGSFGTAGRNILEGPGYRNVNLALLKHLRLGAATRLQLRLEAFNLFNRTNFDLPDNFLGSPTFGRIRSAGSPRRLQLGAKLLF
ncbi:MAG: carboxypeptidase regulatory-like domain-containing protein [Acidobacteria bacterium]|nr:carboxypeptidase regulatory-like domain-containing protein [Acidobacteriota bacterium]